MSDLGRAIRDARKARGLSRQALAKTLGYSERGSNKGARRLQALEETGTEQESLMRAVADALALDPAQLADLARQDEIARAAAWEAWADQPIRPRLIIRYGPHWFLHIAHDMPSDIVTLDEAERHAGERIRAITARLQEPPRGRLIFSRRLHVHLDQHGRVTAREPQTYARRARLPCGEIHGKPFHLEA